MAPFIYMENINMKKNIKKRKNLSKKNSHKNIFNKDVFDSYRDDDCLINVYLGKEQKTNKEKRQPENL
jgi:hypothetical protein